MTTYQKTQISHDERAKREAAVNYVRGNVCPVGFTLSPEIEKINHRFINGELSGDEHIEAIKTALFAEHKYIYGVI